MFRSCTNFAEVEHNIQKYTSHNSLLTLALSWWSKCKNNAALCCDAPTAAPAASPSNLSLIAATFPAAIDDVTDVAATVAFVLVFR